MTINDGLDKDDIEQVKAKLADIKLRQLELIDEHQKLNKAADDLKSIATEHAQLLEVDESIKKKINRIVTVVFIVIMVASGFYQFGAINPHVPIIDKETTCPVPELIVLPESCTEFSGLGFNTKICNNTAWVTVQMILTLVLGTYGGIKLINKLLPGPQLRRKGDLDLEIANKKKTQRKSKSAD